MNYYYFFIIGGSLLGIGLIIDLVRIFFVRKYSYSAEVVQWLRLKRHELVKKYRFFRSLNNFFYIIGAGVSIAGAVLYVVYANAQNTVTPSLPISLNISPEDENFDKADLFELVNQTRQQAGSRKLLQDPVLTKIAEDRLKDMIDNQYYAHKSLAGDYYYNQLARVSANYGFSCENLNIDFTTTESRYVSSWLSSSKGHKECLLNSQVTHAGYAVGIFSDPTAGGGDTKTYIVVGIHAEKSPTMFEAPN